MGETMTGVQLFVPAAVSTAPTGLLAPCLDATSQPSLPLAHLQASTPPQTMVRLTCNMRSRLSFIPAIGCHCGFGGYGEEEEEEDGTGYGHSEEEFVEIMTRVMAKLNIHGPSPLHPFLQCSAGHLFKVQLCSQPAY